MLTTITTWFFFNGYQYATRLRHWYDVSWFVVNPGAKERLVQITGTSEDKIQYV